MKDKTKRFLHYIIYFVAILGVLVLLSGLLGEAPTAKYTENDCVNYDNVLLSPDETENAPEEQKKTDGDFPRVRTSVINIDLTPGEVYGIYSENFTYASKIFVDGKELYSLGTVSETKDGFVPKTGSFSVYFTAKEHTQIVVQRCNFDHARWSPFSFNLGKQNVITRNVQIRQFKNLAVIVFFFALGVINLGFFIGIREKKHYLWYAMSCFSILLNMAFTNPKLIMTVFPNLNWYLGHKAESCSLVLTGAFLILFVHSAVEKPKLKALNIADYIVVGASLLYFIVLPVSIYSRYVLYFGVAAAVYGIIYFVYYALWFIKSRKTVKPIKKLYLLGIFIIVAAIALGASHLSGQFFYTTYIGLIVFEIIMTLALSVEFRDVQEAYEKSRANEEQLSRMNDTMEQGLELQKNFIAIMNHEIRTPLTVIAGYADISAKQLEGDGHNKELVHNLQLVKQEAIRLGRIVEQSDASAKSALEKMTAESVCVYELLENARDFCIPICEKRANTIVIDCDKQTRIMCVYDSVVQILYNLIINASRHTQSGVIRLSAAESEAEVIISVEDNGDGIDNETALHAFEKGFSRDGSHGIGLSVCKEIAESHGGTIEIGKNSAGGATVTIRLPKT